MNGMNWISRKCNAGKYDPTESINGGKIGLGNRKKIKQDVQALLYDTVANLFKPFFYFFA